MNATAIVREALAGTGVELVGSAPAASYDATAPESLRSAALLPGARGIVVAGSGGPALWRLFRSYVAADRSRWDEPHPYDTFVATLLSRADEALTRAGIRHRRFEAAFHATPRLDFVALAHIAGLGSQGPFYLAIHSTHGAWWALRGAWLVDADVDPATELRSPCDGCPAPCIGGRDKVGGIIQATPDVRGRCVVGQASRYEDDQIAYHYDREATVLRLRGLK